MELAQQFCASAKCPHHLINCTKTHTTTTLTCSEPPGRVRAGHNRHFLHHSTHATAQQSPGLRFQRIQPRSSSPLWILSSWCPFQLLSTDPSLGAANGQGSRQSLITESFDPKQQQEVVARVGFYASDCPVSSWPVLGSTQQQQINTQTLVQNSSRTKNIEHTII